MSNPKADPGNAQPEEWTEEVPEEEASEVRRLLGADGSEEES